MNLNGKVISVVIFLVFVFIAVCFAVNFIDNTYKLPPEPNARVNDSTLLGIDTNDNDVRDDVERWIYQTYDTYTPCIEQDISVESSSGEFYTTVIKECNGAPVPYHPIVRELAMQYAKTYQIILQDPKNYRKNIELEDAAYYCNRYFTSGVDEVKKSVFIDPTIVSKLKAVQFNTQNRINAYETYTAQLKGTVYELEQEYYKKYCDFNVDTLLTQNNG